MNTSVPNVRRLFPSGQLSKRQTAPHTSIIEIGDDQFTSDGLLRIGKTVTAFASLHTAVKDPELVQQSWLASLHPNTFRLDGREAVIDWHSPHSTEEIEAITNNARMAAELCRRCEDKGAKKVAYDTIVKCRGADSPKRLMYHLLHSIALYHRIAETTYDNEYVAWSVRYAQGLPLLLTGHEIVEATFLDDESYKKLDSIVRRILGRIAFDLDGLERLISLLLDELSPTRGGRTPLPF